MNDRPSLNAVLAARDLAHVWHPCTQMREHDGALPLIPIVRGEGAFLVDADGRRYLDGISSWWSNLFGHANPRIAAAIAEQAAKLNHVMLAGFTHEPALQLAEELVRIAPPGLARVAYASDGASAVEIALKMSFHYWRNAGHPERTRFIALANAYHGETLGALSVSDLPLYRAVYGPLLFDPIVAPSPDWLDAEPGESADDVALRRLADLRALLERHAQETCAVIIEPLVQCSGGMRMHSPVYLAGLRKLCDEFEVHLIADEIAVGFGRTGTLFACEQASITPDFLCLSKGLTGGALPLSAVLTTDNVYQAFLGDYATNNAFLHSHTFSGNPIACAAALASLAILRDEPVLERIGKLSAHLTERIAPLRDHPHVSGIRQTGLIAAFDLVADKPSRTPYPGAERRGRRFYRHALEHGVLLRPLGDTVYFLPPYCIDDIDIDRMVDVAIDSVAAAMT
ncbi:MAG: Adenosylmethionine-8-amino-7-oxononanoate aminotransferase [Rhodanobacteraceae bacterium]|jgi:adenosylmethionine-8-amino-7-oxononanoate aminotransferase|nr:MAG: Adenosylmethionine-8-amino-7-oxononanoate aminotransferase [Rhodanobacteraceae bacterium]